MKKISLLIIVLSLCFSGHTQILRSIANSAANQAKNSATNKASEKVDKEVDKGVNKFFDNLTKEDTTGTAKKNAKPTNTPDGNGGGNEEPPAGVNKFMKSLGVSNEAVARKEVYKFNSQIVMLNEATDAKGKAIDPVEYVISFNESNSDASFQLKGEQKSVTTTVVDHENMCMLMLTESDGKKTGFATKFDPAAAGKSLENMPKTEESKDKPVEECKMAKTGNSKTISGYSCSEYSCETSEFITIAWITKQFSAKNNSMFGNNAWGASYKTDGLDGMVIQYETRSKKDKSSTTMTLKSVDMSKNSSFSTVGYEISSFSFNQKKK